MLPLSANVNRWLGTFSVSALNALVGLTTGIILARFLAPDGRGELAIIMFWPPLIASLLIFGLPASATYHAARMEGDRHDRFTATLIGLAVLISAAMVAIAWLAIPFVVKDPHLVTVTRIYAAILLPFHCIAIVLQALDQGRLRFGTFNLTRLLPQAIYFLGLVILITLESVSLPAILICHIAGVAMTALFRLAIHRRSIGSGVDFSAARDVLRTGARFHPGQLLTIIRSQADRLLIVLFFSGSDVGLYVVAATLAAQPLVLVNSSFNLLLFPRVAAASDPVEKNRLVGQSFRLCAIAVTPVLLLIVLLAPFLVTLIFGQAYAGAGQVAQVLAVAFAISGLRDVLIEALRGYNDRMIRVWSEAAMLVLFAAMVFASAGLGTVAIAAAFGASAFLSMLLLVWAMHRAYGLAWADLWPFGMRGLADIRQILQARGLLSVRGS